MRASGWGEKMVLQALQRYLWTDFIFVCLMPDLITLVDLHSGHEGFSLDDCGYVASAMFSSNDS